MMENFDQRALVERSQADGPDHRHGPVMRLVPVDFGGDLALRLPQDHAPAILPPLRTVAEIVLDAQVDLAAELRLEGMHGVALAEPRLDLLFGCKFLPYPRRRCVNQCASPHAQVPDRHPHVLALYLVEQVPTYA